MGNSRKIRIVVDTNIWISYFISDRKFPLHLILLNQRFEIITSQELSSEVFEVASRKKFSKLIDQKRLPSLRKLFDQYAIEQKVSSSVSKCRDEKDNFLLALSKDSHADFLITGDSDLLDLIKFDQTRIISISEFIRKFALNSPR